MKEYCCCAPGKVLICGGYAILFPNNVGISTATTAKFCTRITCGELHVDQEQTALLTESHTLKINVRSRQLAASWKYLFFEDKNHENCHLKRVFGEQNAFLEATLFIVLSFILSDPNPNFWRTRCCDNLNIELLADNSFYSQVDNLKERGKEVCLEEISKIEDYSVVKRPTRKTGLGSSAALVVSLVGSLLSCFSSSEIKDFENLMHLLSQFAHCVSQRKIGSGFDVSTAVFGNQIFTGFETKANNFSKLIQEFTEIMTNPEKIEENSESFSIKIENLSHIHSFLANPMMRDVEIFKFPDGFHLTLIDIDGGSNTPSFVSKVLKWKAEQENTKKICKEFEDLGKLNLDFVDKWKNLSNISEKVPKNEYLRFINHLWGPKSSGASASFHKCLQELFEIQKNIRSALKSIGNSAGVPVEPDCQTLLIDKILAKFCPFSSGESQDWNLEEDRACCLLGGVPGAGGFDAAFFIVIGEGDCVLELKHEMETFLKNESKEIFKESATSHTVCILPLEASNSFPGFSISIAEKE